MQQHARHVSHLAKKKTSIVKGGARINAVCFGFLTAFFLPFAAHQGGDQDEEDVLEHLPRREAAAVGQVRSQPHPPSSKCHYSSFSSNPSFEG
jgi:hypothetical protein